MSKENREITSADQLMPGKNYFLEKDDFIGYGKFMEIKPSKKLYEGADVSVPDSQPLAYFDKLTRTFNDRYELLKACRDENVRIYESKEQENEN